MRENRDLWVLIGGYCVFPFVLLGLIIYNIETIFSYYSYFFCGKSEIIATLDVRHQRSVIITAPECWDNNRPIYYEVREAGSVVTPTTYIYSDSGDDSHEFTVLYAEDGALVAVLETTFTPPPVIIVQDFKSGDSWPRSDSSREQIKQKWRNVFERLQRENPQLTIPEYFNR